MKTSFLPCDDAAALVAQLCNREEMMRLAGRKPCSYEYPDSPLSYGPYYDAKKIEGGVALRFEGRECLRVTQADGGIELSSPNDMISPDFFATAEDVRKYMHDITLGEANVNLVREATLGGSEVILVMNDTRMEQPCTICFAPQDRLDIMRALVERFGTLATQDPARYDEIRLKATGYIPKLTCRSDGAPFSSYALLYDGRSVRTVSEYLRQKEGESYIPRMTVVQTALASVQASLVTEALKANGCTYHCNMFFENAASIQLGTNVIDFYDSISSPGKENAGVEPALSIYQDCTGHINVTDRLGWLSCPKPSYHTWKAAEDLLNAPEKERFQEGLEMVCKELSRRVLCQENIEKASADMGLFIDRCDVLDLAYQKAEGMAPKEGEMFVRGVEMDIISHNEGRLKGSVKDIAARHGLEIYPHKDSEQLNAEHTEKKITHKIH